MTIPVALLPKVRSDVLRRACNDMPCTLRVGLFVGIQCAPQATVCGCHLPSPQKGVGTKSSDLFMVAACEVCHSILDNRGMNRIVDTIAQNYGAAFMEQTLRALQETQSRWVAMGLIHVEGGEIV